MKQSNNTVLITGGSSGIGLEFAKRLIENQNTVIICGRSSEKLEQAKKEVPDVHTFQCDVSKQSDCEKLFKWVTLKFPNLNILCNNAALVHKTQFISDNEMIEKAELEVKTNYLAPVILSKIFLPHLITKADSEIIFVTTGLIYAPKAVYPIYCSTKAAVHSFTQTLRMQLKDRIKITEVMMPAVDTPFHNGPAPKISIPVEEAIKGMLKGLYNGKDEIKVAGVRMLYRMSRIVPSLAVKLINKTD